MTHDCLFKSLGMVTRGKEQVEFNFMYDSETVARMRQTESFAFITAVQTAHDKSAPYIYALVVNLPEY